MNRIKYTCGVPIASGCITYTAELPNFIPSDSVSCDANLDEILEKYGDKIDEILENSDLTDLFPGCFTFNPETVKTKELHQIELTELCNHKSRITALEGDLNSLDIGSKSITIDLGCLASAASPCQQSPNTYSLLSILLTLVNKVCELEQQIADLS